MIATKQNISDQNLKKIVDVFDVSNLNWTAEPTELITQTGASVASHRGIVRSDNNQVIGLVGNRYKIIQNYEAFAYLDVLCEEYDATYQYVYTIDNGRLCIMQAKVNGGFEVRKGDTVDKYITAVNSFDGSTMMLAYFTTRRLWCDNQLRGSLREAKDKIAIRHTGTAQDKMKEAFRVFHKSMEYFKAFEQKCKVLAQKVADSQMVDKFLNDIIGEGTSKRKINTREKITELFERGKGNNGTSAWDLYNGLTEYIDHYRGSSDEKRLASSLVGNGTILKAKAFQTALSL